MPVTLREAISAFGKAAKSKLRNPGVTGEPEDQLRAPLEQLLVDLGELCSFPRSAITAVGESSLSSLQTRPDYAITVRNALVGFLEIKAPGKGADPRRFTGRHDKGQWEKLKSLPNIVYTDGNEFSLWRSGDLAQPIVRLSGDVESSGASLEAPPGFVSLFEDFYRWEPIPPSNAKQLAELTARLCRLLREEVAEQLGLGSEALTALATDWRKLLFPEASDAQFADGYAQAVTFGLLMARARDIRLSAGLDKAAYQLSQTNSLIGAALRLLTDDASHQATLKTSLGTLTRVLDAVHWPTITKGDLDAWLYFYEDFLAVYDNKLRKLTGSYYTPPEVVGAMVQLVDDVLRTRFNLHNGLAAPAVRLADPAVGTGTFLLAVFRQIAQTMERDEGSGAVAAAIDASLERIIAFELQLGPFAVAQLRILAELADLIGSAPMKPLRMFVTDTLANPFIEEEWLPRMLAPIGESRRQANQIKRDERITVVIGNPPYKEKAKNRGGWVEQGGPNSPAPLADWIPPRDWGVGAHAKHLRNLYVYFWRWATWKVFDQDARANTGIVSFITVAGFLNGPGFERMRDYLRRKADEIWVIDCSPEGPRPEVNTRIFEAVQQPVCIVLASRSPESTEDVPATVRFRSLPLGVRTVKFHALEKLRLESDGWVECPSEWRAPFLPTSQEWSAYPALEDLFTYNGSGVMPGRTWVIAPDSESLELRWNALIKAPDSGKEALFHPHLRKGKPGDKHSTKVVRGALMGFPPRSVSVANDKAPTLPPVPYAFRSFDRQWIIPDVRLINQPNPELWESRSENQVYLTAPSNRSPSSGPAITFTDLIPDLDHYHGRGGRVFPLWRDPGASRSNIRADILAFLSDKYSAPITGEDLFAYIAGVTAHPAYTKRFKPDLVKPGLRVPITADHATFIAAADLGRIVIWLHTSGSRFVDPGHGRPDGPPRVAVNGPRIPAQGAIPQDPAAFPDSIDYDAATKRLLVGSGYVEGVRPEVWGYELSGKPVVRQWFSYRKANRQRPIIGDRRTPSVLGDVKPDHWLAEYTTDLINLLHALTRLVELEKEQAQLLDRICSGELIPAAEMPSPEVAPTTKPVRKRDRSHPDQRRFLD